MSNPKEEFYRVLNEIIGNERLTNEEAYIINDYVSSLEATYKKQQKEIEQLNNIINELEKTLKEEVKGLYNEENPMLLDETYIKYATERKMAYMYILDKLNELRGDNK